MNAHAHTETQPEYEADDRIDFEYESDAGNARVRRTWVKLAGAGIVRERTTEAMYNYVAEEWEVTHRHTRDYELADDGETLAGDGSNWAGTGRKWKAWAEERHATLCQLRFPSDSIEEGDA